MRHKSEYQLQSDFDNHDFTSSHNDNTSCIDTKSSYSGNLLTFDDVKKKIRALQNSIESDLSELSLHTSELNKSNDYNLRELYNDSGFDATKTGINWNKINEIKANIESDICKASNYLKNVRSNLSSFDNVQVIRYSDIFDQYRKDLHSILSNAENKYNNNLLLLNHEDNADSTFNSNDPSVLLEQNMAIKNSIIDIESLTHEAINILHTSKESNEKFIRIRNKMYSIIDTHLPDVDMIQKNIMHIAVKNQRIIAVTIAICTFLTLLVIFN